MATWLKWLNLFSCVSDLNALNYCVCVQHNVHHKPRQLENSAPYLNSFCVSIAKLITYYRWPICGVLGQNGSGQNGTDKMVWTKWYTDKTALDKMVWTKWHGQNGTDNILRIKSSINPAPFDNMIFFINPASTLTPLAFLYVLIIYLWLLVTKCILNSTELKCTQNIKLYHFVHTILSVPFCPIPFCPYTMLSIPFCPYHFVRYHFVRSPFVVLCQRQHSCRPLNIYPIL